MNIQQVADYGRCASQAVLTLMQRHGLSVLRFRQHVNTDGKVVCGSILQCTDVDGNEILDSNQVDPLVYDLEYALNELQDDTNVIQGNYSCYLLPKHSELPAGITYRIAEGGPDLVVDTTLEDVPDRVIACNLGLCVKTHVYTYLTYRE